MRGHEHRRPLPVRGRPSQVVQVRDRNPRQPREFLLVVLLVLPLQNVARRRPAEALVRAVDLGQQPDVGCGVLAAEPMAPAGSRLQLAGLAVSLDQARDLGPASPRHLLEVGADHASQLLAVVEVLLLNQRLLHPTVDFLLALPGELDLLAGFQKRADRFRFQGLCISHSNLHSLAGCPTRRRTATFQAHLVLESVSASGSSCIGQVSTAAPSLASDIVASEARLCDP